MRGALFLGLLAVVLGSAGCQDTKDRVAEEAIEQAIERRGRDAEVTVDRERQTITIDLGRSRKRKAGDARVATPSPEAR